MKITAYQIYFDEATKRKCHPLLLPYDNSWHEGKPIMPCLENHIICDLIQNKAHEATDYFGVMSWNVEDKVGIKIANVWPEIKGDSDVYSFFKGHTQTNIWQVTERWHPGIIQMAQHVFNKAKIVRVDLNRLHTPMVYQNAFLARQRVYDKYVREWLAPFMEKLLDPNDGWLQTRVNGDTRYKSGLFKKSDIEKVMGMPHYTYHTFICERLFSTYLAYNRHKLIHLA